MRGFEAITEDPGKGQFGDHRTRPPGAAQAPTAAGAPMCVPATAERFGSPHAWCMTGM